MATVGLSKQLVDVLDVKQVIWIQGSKYLIWCSKVNTREQQ